MSEAGVEVKLEDRPRGRTAVVTIDNQRRLNCLSTPIIVRLAAVLSDLAAEASLRAVIITGAGDQAFIGGADLNELGALSSDSARLFITRLHHACSSFRDTPSSVTDSLHCYFMCSG